MLKKLLDIIMLGDTFFKYNLKKENKKQWLH